MAYQYPFRNADEAAKRAVWNKGKPIAGYSPDQWRHDICGAVMKYDQHGNRDDKHGWEIDHIKPKAKNGGDELANLQPLNWQNNAAKGDTYPWNCGR